MELVIIAAVAANGVIGRDGTLPWSYPEDLARFKERTIGHPVIMGRRTFEDVLSTLGEPLPGRTNVVLTRGDAPLPAGVVRARTIDEAIAAAADTGADVAYVAGGASVYGAIFPRVDRLVLTEIHETFEGDVTFPDWDRDAWRERSRESREAFDFVEYVRTDDG